MHFNARVLPRLSKTTMLAISGTRNRKKQSTYFSHASFLDWAKIPEFFFFQERKENTILEASPAHARSRLLVAITYLSKIDPNLLD